MSKISTTLAGAATLALAAVPMLALASSAHAAPVVVKVSDLNLSTAQGAQALDKRIDIAARKFCVQANPANQGGLVARNACMNSVREEVADSLAGQARATELAQR